MPLITDARYEELLDSELQLRALEAAGVDNWDGYDEAMKLHRQWLEEEEDEG